MNTKINQNNLAAEFTTQLNFLTSHQMVAASTQVFAALPASWHYNNITRHKRFAGVSLLFTLFTVKLTIIFPLRVRVRVLLEFWALRKFTTTGAGYGLLSVNE